MPRHRDRQPSAALGSDAAPRVGGSRRAGWLAILALAVTGCDAALPEPESTAARLYERRCGGCHRLYAPGSLTPAMWEMQIARMQGEMTRRGVAPLTTAEREEILEYLRRHGQS